MPPALTRVGLTAFCILTVCVPAMAQSSAGSSSVAVSARFASRSSLRVSTQLLQFQVTDEREPAVATVDFSTGVRTDAGDPVILSVEAIDAPSGPGGPADVESSVSFTGEGPGTLSSPLSPGAPAVAARWIGSGARDGRLVFTLRARARGTYTMRLRFGLTAP